MLRDPGELVDAAGEVRIEAHRVDLRGPQLGHDIQMPLVLAHVQVGVDHDPVAMKKLTPRCRPSPRSFAAAGPRPRAASTADIRAGPGPGAQHDAGRGRGTQARFARATSSTGGRPRAVWCSMPSVPDHRGSEPAGRLKSRGGAANISGARASRPAGADRGRRRAGCRGCGPSALCWPRPGPPRTCPPRDPTGC